MRTRFLRFVALVLFAACCFSGAEAKGNHLDFISNGHQWPAAVRYKAELPGGAMFLTGTGFTYSYYSLPDLTRIHSLRHEKGGAATEVADEEVHWHAYNVSFNGCNTSAEITPLRKRPNYYNYFQGNDPGKWSGGMGAYEEVDYSNIYRGIDLKVYSEGISAKYDFVLKPYADADAIQLAFDGVTPELLPDGDLLIRTTVNELREQRPFAYQVINGRRRQVACRYVLKKGVVSFAFPEGYAHDHPLIIDPTLVFATYSGGTGTTYGWSATYDGSGNLYAGGESFSTGWPVTTGAFKTTFGGAVDAGINKYSSNGTTLIYSTYYGGTAGDYPNTMVTNKAGELIMAGATTSTDLPVTSGCFDNTANGNTDVYVVHFNATGTSLLGATYLGGNGSEGNTSTGASYEANRGEVITDAASNIYVAFGTSSANFPVTANAYQTSLHGTMDAFVAKLNSTCSSLLFSTYLGGSDNDAATALQLTKTGNVVVGGGTKSSNFPGAATGWQTSLQGQTDGFIAILNPTASTLLNATYVGTSGVDDVSKIQVDHSGNIYATGIDATGSFPVSSGAYSITNGRVYMCKLDPTLGNRLLSTTLGSGTSTALNPSAFLLDNCGNLYFVGYGTATGLVTTTNAFQTAAGGFWMCVLGPNMASLYYASYFGKTGDHIDGGSSRLDPLGIVYHSICTNNASQPTTSNAWSPTKKAPTYDIASWKFDFQAVGMFADFDIGTTDTFCVPAVVTINNSSYGAVTYSWDFGDGSAVSTSASPPAHTYTKSGVYTIRLRTYNSNACITVDSQTHTIYVYGKDTIKLINPGSRAICKGDDSVGMSVQPEWTITVSPSAGVGYQQKGGSAIAFLPDTTTTYHVYASLVTPCGAARDSIQFTITIDTTTPVHQNQLSDTALCANDTAIYHLNVPLTHYSISPANYYRLSDDKMTIRFFPPHTTRYEIVHTSSNLCRTISDSLIFTISRSELKAAFTLDPLETDLSHPLIRLTNKTGDAATTDWYLNHGFWTHELSPSYTAPDTGYYCFTLIASDVYHCVDSATECAHVIEAHIYVPSAFTPNDDGRNDAFRLIVHNAKLLDFSVYNRFGQQVFSTSDPQKGWDGTFKGKQCDLGTYFYQVQYQVLDQPQKVLKGDVSLVR